MVDRMSAPPTNVDVISLATAALAAARSAEGEAAVFYAATARSAIDQLAETLRRLTLNLTTLEAELVRRAPKQMKEQTNG